MVSSDLLLSWFKGLQVMHNQSLLYLTLNVFSIVFLLYSPTSNGCQVPDS